MEHIFYEAQVFVCINYYVYYQKKYKPKLYNVLCRAMLNDNKYSKFPYCFLLYSGYQTKINFYTLYIIVIKIIENILTAYITNTVHRIK